MIDFSEWIDLNNPLEKDPRCKGYCLSKDSIQVCWKPNCHNKLKIEQKLNKILQKTNPENQILNEIEKNLY